MCGEMDRIKRWLMNIWSMFEIINSNFCLAPQLHLHITCDLMVMEPSTSQNINHLRNSYPLKIRTIKSRFFNRPETLPPIDSSSLRVRRSIMQCWFSHPQNIKLFIIFSPNALGRVDPNFRTREQFAPNTFPRWWFCHHPKPKNPTQNSAALGTSAQRSAAHQKSRDFFLFHSSP